MSYSLLSAIGKPVGGGGRWVSVDISNMSFTDIFQNYIRVIATLSNPYDSSNTALDLADIEFTEGDPSMTFSQYLLSIGNAALSTTANLPVLDTVYAKYNDAWNAGYMVTPIAPDAAIDSPLPDADKTWLKLTDYDDPTNPEVMPVDFTLFGKSCMVSVNGYWHYLATDNTGAYIRDGNTSCVKSKRNTIGIYSLASLGSIQYIDLTADMIYKQDPSNTLSNGVYIDIGQSLSGKTVLLVIAGYLHVMDGLTFNRVGDQLIKIDWPNFPYFDRYFEQVDAIDLSSMNLSHTVNNPSQVAVSELLSDTAITAYCSLSQSFIVLLDNEEVFVDFKDVADTGVPGMYVSAEEPNWPLITGHGKVSEWWSVEEDGQWAILTQTPDALMDRRVYYTTDPKQLNSLASNRVPARPSILSAARFIKLGTDVNFTS